MQPLSNFLFGVRNIITRGWFLKRALLSLAFSVLGAGFAYTAWLALFLSAYDQSELFYKAVLWLLTPIVTAVGYAAGLVIADRLNNRETSRFLTILLYPLVGCIIGAGIVFPLGPMLIVFGMFILGTIAVAIREIFIAGKGSAPG